MRKLLTCLGMILFAVMVFCPMKSNAAEKKICQTLKTSKTYHYNLDQKGKKESIRVDVISRKKYEKKESDYQHTVYDVKAAVTINGKQIYSKVAKEQYYMSEKDYLSYIPIKVMVTDIDKRDKQMELLIFVGDCVEFGTDTIEHIYYYQYTNGRAKKKQDLVSLFSKSLPYVKYVTGVKNSSILTINEKNEIFACVGLNVPNFLDGHIQTNVSLLLKNGKFMHKIQKSYKIAEIEEPIRTKKRMIVYASPGGRKKAFTLKKQVKINLCNIYLKNKKKMYLKIKNQGGKSGYIDPKKMSIYIDVDPDYWD